MLERSFQNFMVPIELRYWCARDLCRMECSVVTKYAQNHYNIQANKALNLALYSAPVSLSYLSLLRALPFRNEAPRSKTSTNSVESLRGIKAQFRRSQPAFALAGFDAVRPTIHPCSPAESGTGYSGEGE